MSTLTRNPTSLKHTGNKALNQALSRIHQRFGENSIDWGINLTSQLTVKFTSTGIPELDDVLGGGWPQGRLVEIYGPPSSGKTCLALHAIAQTQKAGGTAVLIDLENAFEPTFAQLLGVDLGNLIISRPETAEAALEIILSLVKSKLINIIVLDSVAALLPACDLAADMENSNSRAAPLMAKALRLLMHVIHPNCTIVFLNQMRFKEGVIYGSAETTPGGQALRCYATLRLDCRAIAPLQRGQTHVGTRLRIKPVKNKVAAPFRSTELDLLFDEGLFSTQSQQAKQAIAQQQSQASINQFIQQIRTAETIKT